MPRLPTFFFKTLLFVFALIPFSIMVWKTLNDDLGANPVEELSQLSGLWSLRFLLITLALSPIKIIFKQPGVIKFRRMLGLFTFFYSTVHLAVFVVLENELTWRFILEDIYTNPTVDIGLAAYLLLIPLALTSTNRMMRNLGKAWKKLHLSVHAVALLVILHFVLSEKADNSAPFFYGALLLTLLTARAFRHKKITTAPLRRSDLLQ
ncbi:MAG: sulfite oxidase heme-binding subunit YedZ [Gammaproteobacteria bacterium]